MTPLLSMGETLAVNASIYPDKIGARDLRRSMTFREWNRRSCRLTNALLGLGLTKGDRIAVLAYNCVEWMEIYAACAKAGLIVVPINFRLLGGDIVYILEDCAARALIVQDPLLASLESIRSGLAVPEKNLVHFGSNATPGGFVSYEDLLARAADTEPGIAVTPDDTWVLMYTSGTTGKPKGAMRSHGSHALLNYATLFDMQFNRDDTCLLVMPMCHANSLNFASAFAYAGATCCVYDVRSFDPGHLLQTLTETRASFTSLVPTHYIMLLGLAQSLKDRYTVDSVRKLLTPRRRPAETRSSRSWSTSQTRSCWSCTARPSRAGQRCCGRPNN